jgi:flavodoxin
MKSLVVYSSLTGNTKMVAQAIAQELDADIKTAAQAPAAESYDLVAVGFWVDKGNADEQSIKYLQSLRNAKVALFATLGADPKSEHAGKCLDKAAGLLDASNQIVGKFICQGKIDPQLIERMNKMFAGQTGNPHAPGKERDERHKKASTHPDAEDLSNARAAFAQIKNALAATI